jgi:hypothetical protein
MGARCHEMKTLDEIGQANDCDRSQKWHAYFQRYEPYVAPLRETPVKMLEIGVLKGSGMRTWSEYFQHGTIYGIDIEAGCLNNLPARCIGVHGDTNNISFWTKWPEFDFDIIIDDGDHHASSQEFCFRKAWPRVAPGGLYIIEDIFFSRGGIMPFLNALTTEINDQWGGANCGNPYLDKSTILFAHHWKGCVIVGKKNPYRLIVK